MLNFMDLIKALVRRDLKAKYKHSLLGYIWTWLDPLLQILVFTLVFGIILKIRTENFPVYLITGLVPWLFFSQTLIGCVGVITGNAELIRRVFFPREIYPLTLALSNTIHMLFSLIVVMILVFAYGLPLTIKIFFLPVTVIFLFLMALGFGFILSSLNVFFRDFSHFMPALIRLWFFLTPIFYVLEGRIPEKYLATYFVINPLAIVLSLFRASLMGYPFPDLKYIFTCFLSAILIFLFGYAFFKKYEDHMVKRI